MVLLRLWQRTPSNIGGISRMATIIEQINQENLKAETPSFNVGDTVKV